MGRRRGGGVVGEAEEFEDESWEGDGEEVAGLIGRVRVQEGFNGGAGGDDLLRSGGRYDLGGEVL